MKLRNTLKKGYRKKKPIPFAHGFLPYALCLFALVIVDRLTISNLSEDASLVVMLALGFLYVMLLLIIVPLIFKLANRRNSRPRRNKSILIR